MKRAVKFTFSLLIVFALSTNIFANGLSLNSVGTKALGMGGAFVALSNDATAIYWNPAGLAGQSSSLQFFFTGVMPSGTYEYARVNISVETESVIYPTGGIMGVYNMDKFTFALGVYVPSGLGAEYDGSKLAALVGGKTLWRSRIGVISISPSFAYQVSDQFSVGLSLNINYGLFDLDQAVKVESVGAFQYTEESTGLGFSATLGLKYDFNDQFAMGLSVRTPSKIAMSGTAENAFFKQLFNEPKSDFDRDVTWPLWIAGGLAYKPTKCLTLVLDAQYSQWSELDELVTEFDNAVWKGATEPTGDNKFILQWEDAVQIRLGGEYMVTPMTALRLGYYYDPAPAPDETLNILFPSSTNHVVTAGFGYTFNKYSIDAALEYLIGGDRVAPAENKMPGVHHLDVFAFSVGFSMGL